MNTSKLIAQILLKEKAVFLRPQDPFTWTSGIKSPVYCDNRLLISTVESRQQIVTAFANKIMPMNVDVIAGTATAGIPWAAWIAMELNLPLVYVRSSFKDHGRQNAIEGQIESDQSVVLIEDLISTGKSSIAAAKKLEEAGVIIKSVMSIFSYGFSQATQIFKEANVATQSLTDFETLAQVAVENNYMDSQSLNQVLEWKKGVIFP
jgi:orotate phosphoribosyltransferase